MSPVLPFDIIVLIIDMIGENNDTNLLKELALVSHSFLQICRKHIFATVELHDAQICSKHLFATVELHDADPKRHVPSSKKGFVKLLERRPDVVEYIRKLTYTINHDHVLPPHFASVLNFDNEDNLLSSILPNFLRTIPRLNSLKIHASQLDWNKLNPSLISALLHLMQLPTINHIDLSSIYYFPLSSFTPSVNLLRLDIENLRDDFDSKLDEDGSRSPKFVGKLESIPKIRHFRTFNSYPMTKKLLHGETQCWKLFPLKSRYITIIRRIS